jgi:ATP-dependent protease HslVU (ClpYQ) ATPase subunit
MNPNEIVQTLSQYIIGQDEGKRAMAIALRSRWQRRQLPEEQRAEVSPFNILMRGPTGTGKTEIARRLASTTDSPFTKTEMTKFTAVGFHGADLTAVIDDLVDAAMVMEKERGRKDKADAAKDRATEKILDELVMERGRKELAEAAKDLATERILDELVGPDGNMEVRAEQKVRLCGGELDAFIVGIQIKVVDEEDDSDKKSLDAHGILGLPFKLADDEVRKSPEKTIVAKGDGPKTLVREALEQLTEFELERLIKRAEIVEPERLTKERMELKKKLCQGEFDDHMIGIHINKKGEKLSKVQQRFHQITMGRYDATDQLPTITTGATVPKTRVQDAMEELVEIETDNLVNESEEDLSKRAIANAEQNGIIFLDEVDKLCHAGEEGHGTQVQKGQGVQKELLSLIEVRPSAMRLATPPFLYLKLET